MLGWLFWQRHDIREIRRSMAYLNYKGDLLMATMQEVQDAVGAEAAEVAAKLNELAVEIQALKDAVAAGSAVTAADLDTLKASVEGIFTPAPAPTE